jgi:hypothetical protein
MRVRNFFMKHYYETSRKLPITFHMFTLMKQRIFRRLLGMQTSHAQFLYELAVLEIDASTKENNTQQVSKYMHNTTILVYYLIFA